MRNTGMCSLGSGPTGRRIRRKVWEEWAPEPGLGVIVSEGGGFFRQDRE